MKLRCIESYSDHYKVGEEYEVIEQLENDRFIIPHPNDVTDTVNVPLNGYLWRFEIAKENKGMKEFKVGQKVRIRDWNDMVKEFGVNGFGDVLCKIRFCESMKDLCGKYFTIEDIQNTSQGHSYVNIGKWKISPCMCELVEDVKKKVEEELNFKTLINEWENVAIGDRFKSNDNSYIIEKDGDEDMEIIDECGDELGYRIYINPSDKFTKLEKELTLDDFKIGEFFRVADCQGEFVKIVIVDEMYIFCKIANEIIHIKEEQLKGAKFIKIGENE